MGKRIVRKFRECLPPSGNRLVFFEEIARTQPKTARRWPAEGDDNELKGNASAELGFLWAVNPKAEPVEIDSHSTPKALSRGLLTVPDDATRAGK